MDIIEKIRKLLFNYDLAIAYAKAEIKIREDIIESFKGVRRKTTIRAFTEAKIEKDKYENLLARFVNTRMDLLTNVSMILDRYIPDDYKKVFEMSFLKQMPRSEISRKTGLAPSTIKKFEDKIKRDLIEFYQIDNG